VLDPKETQDSVDAGVLSRSPPKGDRLAILVPIRDAVARLDAFVEAISGTDIPKERTKLVFCVSDSGDGTSERLTAIVPRLRQRYRDVILLTKNVGNRFEHSRPWKRKSQRSRRAGLAAIRNHLIDHGLDATDDWALWIDVDIWRLPPDLFQRLRCANARIVAPHCVLQFGGPTHDVSSFLNDWTYPKDFYYRHVRDGIFQPPRSRGRVYLDSLRHSERIELDSVGATTLLVDAGLHRGGLRFPEVPYKDLIETEAFGALARDLGIRVVGLPNLEVLHMPY
jgi:glycosyltransferase involved in cell wall biosynthesis